MDSFNIDTNRKLLGNCISQFQQYWRIYTKMYAAYLGIDLDKANGLSMTGTGLYDDLMFNDTDNGNYDHSYINDRYTHNIKTNYIKKFVDEEVAFSTSLPIGYQSKSGDNDIIDKINYEIAHWSASCDSDLCRNMLIHSECYELYYVNSNAEFCSKIISPRHGYAYTDQFGNVVFFLHIYKQGFDIEQYVDIYTANEIIHCNINFEEVAPRQTHIFGQVPVAICTNSEDGWTNSIYNNIIGLQSSLQEGMNETSEELSEFRNAYMAFYNCQLEEGDLKKMKKEGILKFRGEGKAEWLTKNINDGFLVNNLNMLQDKIYELGNHVNNNEKQGSNVSSIAMKAKLIDILQKCKLNNQALENAIRTRIKLLLTYVNKMENKNYDYKDVNIVFTMNLPNDDLQAANICNLMQDKLPLETQLALFSFIQNPDLVAQQVREKQEQNTVGTNLLDQARAKAQTDKLANSNDMNDTNGGVVDAQE